MATRLAHVGKHCKAHCTTGHPVAAQRAMTAGRACLALQRCAASTPPLQLARALQPAEVVSSRPVSWRSRRSRDQAACSHTPDPSPQDSCIWHATKVALHRYHGSATYSMATWHQRQPAIKMLAANEQRCIYQLGARSFWNHASRTPDAVEVCILCSHLWPGNTAA